MFGKKKLTTAEEILTAIKGLPEEEQEKLMAAINGANDEAEVAEGTEDVVADDKGETDEAVDETAVVEEENNDGVDKDETDGEEIVDDKNNTEVVAEENAKPVVTQEEPATDDKYADILGRLEALEAKFEAMQHKPVEADEDVAHKLDKLASRFGG